MHQSVQHLKVQVQSGDDVILWIGIRDILFVEFAISSETVGEL